MVIVYSMKKYLFLLGGTLILFYSCVSKRYIYIRNATNDVLYIDNGCMGIKSHFLKNDSLTILEIILSGKVLKHAVCPEKYYGLKLVLDSDTIHIPENEYNSILDSVILKFKKEDPCELIVTKPWFDQQKKSLNQ